MRKLIKKILKENELQWINDVKSNQDIAQEIADKSEIKNDRLYAPFLRLYPAPFFFPPLFSVSLPSSTILSSFTKYYKEQYGLNDEDDINDVLERYKKLVRDKVNNINESDDLQWINDVKSNQDIAQDIADETKIKNNRLYLPSLLLPPFALLPFALVTLAVPPPFFTKYGKEQYGLSEDDINDVWKRYKKLVRDKVSNLNESDDMQWIKDIEPYVPFDEVVIGGKYAVQVMDSTNFEIALEECGEGINGIPLYVIVEKKAKLEYGDIYCWGRNSDVVPHWDGVKECLELTFYNKHGDYLLNHWLAPDGLIRFVNVF